MQTALGLRAHSGWAALVAVAGSIDAPQVLDRRRIIIADPDIAGSKQPYHAATGLAFDEAEALVTAAIESSRTWAIEALSAAVKNLWSRGHEVVGCAVLIRTGKPLPDLAKILTSHALIHTAEGQMFRDVLLWAAKECRLPAIAVPEGSLDESMLDRVGSLGKLIGPPWTQDQKFAAVAGFMKLFPRWSA